MSRFFIGILFAILLSPRVASSQDLMPDKLGVVYETEQWHINLNGVSVDVSTDDGGIEANDIFIALNNRILTGYPSFVQVWQAAPYGRVSAILIRDGQVVHSHLYKRTRQQLLDAGWAEKYIQQHQNSYFSWWDLWNKKAEGPLVHVVDVLPLSRAAQAGIRSSDRIRSLDGDRVEFMTSAQLQTRLVNARTIRVERNDAAGQTAFVDLDILSPRDFQNLVDSGRVEQYTVYNTTPFYVQASLIRVGVNNSTSPPSSLMIIPPGTKHTDLLTHENAVLGSAVGIYIETVVSDDPILSYLYGDNRWYQWPIGDGPDVLTVVDYEQGDRPYAKMQRSGYKGIHHQYIVALPPRDNPLAADPTSGNLEDVAAAMVEAAALSQSLRLQLAAMEFERQGKNIFETGLGIDTTKDNPVEPGVLVESTWNVLISGEDNPIRPGDILLRYSGEPVHGYWDVLARTIIHGSDINRGINVPVTFTVYRPSTGRLISGTTSYFYDESMIRKLVPEQALSDEAVGAYAAFDSILLSFGDEVSGILGAIRYNKPIETSMWEAAQFEAIRRQMNPEAYMIGEFATIPFSLPRAALKRIGPRFMRPVVGSTFGIIVTEPLEAALLDIGDPLGRTREQMIESLKWTLPITGIATATIAPAVNYSKRALSR